MYNLSNFLKKSGSLLLLLLLVGPLSASTIHAVIFAGTQDATIGEGNQVSYDLIRKELNRIHQIENDLFVEFYDFTGDQFKLDNLSQVKNQLKSKKENLKNDILFFIFIGHGFNQATEVLKYPNLVFLNTKGSESESDILDNSQPLQQIIQDFQLVLQPRLFIAYAEACNDNYIKGGDEPLASLATPDLINTASLRTTTPKEKFHELFVEPEGLVVFTSSRASQPSYVSSTQGGVYTQSFVKALQLETSMATNRKATLKSVFDHSKKLVTQISSGFTWTQTPQYTENLKSTPLNSNTSAATPPSKKKRGLIAWLIAKLAPNKIKKQMKKAFEKDGTLLSLNMAIPVDDAGDRMRKKMYTKNPMMYFIQEALVSEEQGRAGEALRNYNIAHGLWSDGYYTSHDEKLMKQMKNMDANNLTGIRSHSSYALWLNHKRGIFEGIFTDKIGIEDANISEYEMRIAELENSIETSRNEINALRAESDRTKIRIDSLDKPREQTVELQLKDMRNTSKSTMQNIREVVKKGRSIGASDFPVNEQEVSLEDNAVVKFKYGKRRMDSNLRPDIKGYKLGKYCTEDIVSFTQDLMEILLLRVDEVPPANLKDIVVKLNITGNADWIGGTRKLGIKYAAKKDIDEQYKDKNGESQTFYVSAGETIRIDNKELAFLRAYCAYETILAILNSKGINNVEVYFTAIAWPIPPNTSPRDQEAGKAYRGVDISVSIKNLYKHYVEEIEKLEERLEEIKEEIRGRQANIEENEALILALENKIAVAKAEKLKLENILNAAKIDPGMNTEASNIVKEVKSAW